MEFRTERVSEATDPMIPMSSRRFSRLSGTKKLVKADRKLGIRAMPLYEKRWRGSCCPAVRILVVLSPHPVCNCSLNFSARVCICVRAIYMHIRACIVQHVYIFICVYNNIHNKSMRLPLDFYKKNKLF